MKKLNEVLKGLKDDLSGLLSTMLISERMNSQKCIAKDLDTTKTIVDYKDESDEFSQEDLNRIGRKIGKLTEDIKGMANVMLTSERINSQRCIAKDIDTTKTIIDAKNESNKFTEEDIKNLVEEAKKIVATMLISERVNSQRCIAKDIDTTRTIIDYDDKKDEISKSEIEKITNELKGIVDTMLVSERINSQRCIAKDIDTTTTIIEQK
jgi:hypothetical protein